MREIRSSGSVEGVISNGHSYSDSPPDPGPLLAAQLVSHLPRVGDEREQEGEILTLGVGHVVDIHGSGLHEDRPEQVGPWDSPRLLFTQPDIDEARTAESLCSAGDRDGAGGWHGC